MDNTAPDAATAGIIAGAFIVYAVIILAFMALFIWLYWRIFAKAGYNGALAFLNLVPGFGPLICVLILAFGRWPVEDELAALRSGRPAAPPPGSTLTT
jgi:hypothetical protein